MTPGQHITQSPVRPPAPAGPGIPIAMEHYPAAGASWFRHASALRAGMEPTPRSIKKRYAAVFVWVEKGKGGHLGERVRLGCCPACLDGFTWLSRLLPQQSENELAALVGLRQSRNAGLRQDLIFGQIGDLLRHVGIADGRFRSLAVLRLRLKD